MTKKNEHGLNVAHIENNYTKEQLDMFHKQRKQIIFKRRRMAVILGLAAVIFAFAGYHLLQDYFELKELEVQKAKSLKEQKKVKSEKDELAYQVNLLHDSDYVQKLIRSRYLYSKEGETIYNYPQVEGSSGEEEVTVEQPTTSTSK